MVAWIKPHIIYVFDNLFKLHVFKQGVPSIGNLGFLLGAVLARF